MSKRKFAGGAGREVAGNAKFLGAPASLPALPGNGFAAEDLRFAVDLFPADAAISGL